MQNILFFIIIAIVGIVAFAFVWFKNSKRGSGSQEILMIQNQLQDLRNTIDEKLGISTKMFQQQYSESTRNIKEVTEAVTRLNETSKQVVNFAGQLQNLQDILQNPKQRGVLGEYYLETILKNVLPPHAYKMQYKLGKDETGKELMVDAVIVLKDRLIPIDSKFSLENYNRIVQEKNPVEREKLEKIFKQDLKNRIDETSKYINPGLGTVDFAIMFIPSEAIYYDLTINQVGAVKVNTQDLIQYATKDKRVHVVSPNSFYAYLQTILQGLRMLSVEESTKEIQKGVEQLSRHIIAHDAYFKKLGDHLGTTVNTYNIAYKELKKVDKDVFKITEGKTGGEIEPLQLQKPEQEEY